MQKLNVKRTAQRLGVSTKTVHRWSDSGRLPCTRVNARGDRRFRVTDVDALLTDHDPSAQEREVLYLRVSGRGDQLSSLAAQETELRASASGKIVQVYKDIGSGLNENRRGLAAAVKAAKRGEYDVLRVTHADRLTRFGEKTLRELLAEYGVRVEVLHAQDESGPEQELMDDFMALLASFSGRLYGQRSAAAKQRLLRSLTSEVKA